MGWASTLEDDRNCNMRKNYRSGSVKRKTDRWPHTLGAGTPAVPWLLHLPRKEYSERRETAATEDKVKTWFRSHLASCTGSAMLAVLWKTVLCWGVFRPESSDSLAGVCAAIAISSAPIRPQLTSTHNIIRAPACRTSTSTGRDDASTTINEGRLTIHIGLSMGIHTQCTLGAKA